MRYNKIVYVHRRKWIRGLKGGFVGSKVRVQKSGKAFFRNEMCAYT